MIPIVSTIRKILMSVVLLATGIAVYGQEEPTDLDKYFSRESFSYGSTTLNYRCAHVGPESPALPALVLYIHNGIYINSSLNFE